MAASGTQRNPWLVTLLVAVIGALGVIGATVIPRLLDRDTAPSGGQSSSSGAGGEPVRINAVRIQAEHVTDRSSDVQLRAEAGVGYLAYITDGAWAVYDGERLGTGDVRSITARVASASPGGDIEIRLDGAGGPLIGRCTVQGTGGWLTWRIVQCDVVADVSSTPSQIHLGFVGAAPTREDPYLFNLDWLDLR